MKKLSLIRGSAAVKLRKNKIFGDYAQKQPQKFVKILRKYFLLFLVNLLHFFGS